jgi:cytochrome c
VKIAALLIAGWWLALLVGAAWAQVPADPARGAQLFEARCARCHGLAGDGPDGLGPSLHGLIGRRAASRNDYLYTRALEARTDVWTPELLDVFLADPQGFAPGTEMEIRVADPAERAALVAHVASLH